ncbi:L-dopachrome tautomerase-related protein [Winogradskyella sp.]|uniref:L-dopachrome tautomerase-related protein n=1 Tax=Winogradskyella sp. TaxID=1883156 RepID=UPI003BAA0C08
MKQIVTLILFSMLLLACKDDTKTQAKEDKAPKAKITEITSITGQQLTGVTVSNHRVFVNFPRWRKDIRYSVAEVGENDNFRAYPNEQWNSWELGQPVTDSTFVCVQSVVASNNLMYVIDTRNPLFQGVIEQPVIFVFDLNTNQLVKTYKLPKEAYHKDSYINDIRIDNQSSYVYCTDSGNSGLLVLSLKTGEAKRVLDDHPSTSSEQSFLTIDGKTWNNSVHSDGIAFDATTGTLYYHALTGYNLYAIPVDTLINGDQQNIENSVELVAKTAAPDGMIVHKGMLYYADLEQHKILQMDLKSKVVSTLLEGDSIKWADTFSVEDDDLYYTNSRIHEAAGDISNLVFTVNKIHLTEE